VSALDRLALLWADDTEVVYDRFGDARLIVDPQVILEREGIPCGRELEEDFAEQDLAEELEALEL
jgi:hypothetical protein